jgi:hypothetical protein
MQVASHDRAAGVVCNRACGRYLFLKDAISCDRPALSAPRQRRFKRIDHPGLWTEAGRHLVKTQYSTSEE